MAPRTRQLERAQSDAVHFSWQPAAPLVANTDANSSRSSSSEPVWTGVVHNDSRRPVRDVVAADNLIQFRQLGSQIVAEIIALSQDQATRR